MKKYLYFILFLNCVLSGLTQDEQDLKPKPFIEYDENGFGNELNDIDGERRNPGINDYHSQKGYRHEERYNENSYEDENIKEKRDFEVRPESGEYDDNFRSEEDHYGYKNDQQHRYKQGPYRRPQNQYDQKPMYKHQKSRYPPASTENLPTQDVYARYFNYFFRRPPGYLRAGYDNSFPKHPKNMHVNPMRLFRGRYRKYPGPWYRPPLFAAKPMIHPSHAYAEEPYEKPMYEPVKPDLDDLFAAASSSLGVTNFKPQTSDVFASNECPPVAKTCPQCVDALELDLLTKLCSYQNIQVVTLDSKPMKMLDQTFYCGKATFHSAHRNFTQLPYNFLYSFAEICECNLPIEEADMKAIIVAPNAFSSNKVSLNDQTYIVNYSILNMYDVERAIQKCQSNNK